MLEEYMTTRAHFCVCLLEECWVGIQQLKLGGVWSGLEARIKPLMSIASQCFDDLASADASRTTRATWIQLRSGLLMNAEVVNELAKAVAFDDANLAKEEFDLKMQLNGMALKDLKRHYEAEGLATSAAQEAGPTTAAAKTQMINQLVKAKVDRLRARRLRSASVPFGRQSWQRRQRKRQGAYRLDRGTRQCWLLRRVRRRRRRLNLQLQSHFVPAKFAQCHVPTFLMLVSSTLTSGLLHNFLQDGNIDIGLDTLRVKAPKILDVVMPDGLVTSKMVTDKSN